MATYRSPCWVGFSATSHEIDTGDRDDVLAPQIEASGWQANMQVYGALTRPWWRIALSSVMRRQGLRGVRRGSSLIHHSDRGSQSMSIRYNKRLAGACIEPSVDSKQGRPL